MRKKTPKPKVKPADKLIKTSKKADIELTEEELERVSGGGTAVEWKYNLKI